MPDVVVTVPKGLWSMWLAEGELPGQERWPCVFCPPWGDCNICEGTGELTPGDTRWDFYMGGSRPKIQPGERVYIVAHGHLRGYSPLTQLVDFGKDDLGDAGYSLQRSGGAVACTIPDPEGIGLPLYIRGFQGFRYRWWEREAEIPFPDWQTANVGTSRRERRRAA